MTSTREIREYRSPKTKTQGGNQDDGYRIAILGTGATERSRIAIRTTAFTRGAQRFAELGLAAKHELNGEEIAFFWERLDLTLGKKRTYKHAVSSGISPSPPRDSPYDADLR